MILTITGPSASGKTSLARALITRIKGSSMVCSITTRPARPSDLHGEYRYEDEGGFEQLEERGAFLWTVNVYGNRYGTLKEDAKKAAEAHDVSIAILTVSATRSLHDYLKEIGKESEVLSIYLDVADEEMLRLRLKKRGDTPESIDVRVGQSRAWAKERDQSQVPYLIYNAGEQSDYLAEKVLAVLRERGKLPST